MNDVSILSRNDSLDKNSHIDLIQIDAKLLDGEECTFVELTGPDLFDGEPGLVPLVLLDAKIVKLFLEIIHMHIFIVECETHDELLAQEEHFVHFSDTFDRLDFLDGVTDLFLDAWFEPKCILSHLEWN